MVNSWCREHYKEHRPLKPGRSRYKSYVSGKSSFQIQISLYRRANTILTLSQSVASCDIELVPAVVSMDMFLCEPNQCVLMSGCIFPVQDAIGETENLLKNGNPTSHQHYPENLNLHGKNLFYLMSFYRN